MTEHFIPPKFATDWSDDEIAALNDRFESAPPTALLRWAHEKFGDRLALASSFGREDVVLIDLIAAADLPIRIFTLDTGRLHQETYDVMARIRRRYDRSIEVYFPDHKRLESMLESKGPNSFYDSRSDRQQCCFIRKLEPLKRALATCDAWITGLRRQQNITRQNTPKISVDRSQGNILKLNPLAHWDADAVDAHITTHDVPYNALHDQGFPSIGCAPCTRAVAPGEPARAGRWWWEAPESKECGLHKE